MKKTANPLIISLVGLMAALCVVFTFNQTSLAAETLEGWVEDNGNWYYYVDGSKVKSWYEIDGRMYYFDSYSGKNYRDIVVNFTWEERSVYFGPDGVPYNDGWHKKVYTNSENGEQHVYWYYAKEDGNLMYNEWLKWNGKWYFFFKGDMVYDEWIYDANYKTYYHFDSNGALIGDSKEFIGWKKINGYWHYFDRKNHEPDGWFQLNGKWYCSDPDEVETGVFGHILCMNYGYSEPLYMIDGKGYWFNSDCQMETGWKRVSGGKWMYFDPNTGAMATGWKYLEGNWYYFGDRLDGYYFNQFSCTSVGRKYIDGNYYYFDADGKMVTGFIERNGITEYYAPSGKQSYWWQLYEGKWYLIDPYDGLTIGHYRNGYDYYYFNEDGSMYIGWFKEDGYWYYYKSNGLRAERWQYIDNKWYYFTSDNGHMITGEQYINGYYYRFDESGAMLTGWYSPFFTYYYAPSGERVYGWYKIDGKWYYFGDGGKMEWDEFIEDGDKTYRVDSDGVMVTGWYKYRNNWYFFNRNTGAMVTEEWIFDNGHYYLLDEDGIMVHDTLVYCEPIDDFVMLNSNGTF